MSINTLATLLDTYDGLIPPNHLWGLGWVTVNHGPWTIQYSVECAIQCFAGIAPVPVGCDHYWTYPFNAKFIDSIIIMENWLPQCNHSTLPTAATSPPEGLTVTSTSSTSISIMWGEVPCSGRNAEIHAYILNYYPIDSLRDQNGGVLGSTGLSNRVFTASGLIPRTRYTFEVRANHFDFSASSTVLPSPPAIISIATEMFQGDMTDIDSNLIFRWLPLNC